MRVTHTTHYLAIYLVSKHEMDATWTLSISLSTRASRALCCRRRVCTRPHPPGPELVTSHPAEEAPCGEVVHLHLGVCVRALLGSLGSLGIWLLQPGVAPHRRLVAAPLLLLCSRHSVTIASTGILVGSAHSLPSSQMVMSEEG